VSVQCALLFFYLNSDVDQIFKSCVNHYFSLSFLRKKPTNKEVRRHVSSLSKIQSNNKIKVYYSNLKNAVETDKIAVDSCYVLRQFLTPLPLIDFREIRGLKPVNHGSLL
jgi:hypothetical protein